MVDDATYDEGNDKSMVWVDDEGRAIYRASALGMCTTAAIAVRSGFTAMATPKAMQDRFNEGHLHEPDIVRRANTEYGLEVFDRQREDTIWITPTVGIRGHIDGRAVGWTIEERDLGLHRSGVEQPERVFEAKTMSQAAFTKWQAMSWSERWAAYPGYSKQLTCYKRMLGLDEVVYAVKNKESGQLLVETYDGETWPWGAIAAQVLGIEAHVRQGLPLPEECNVRSFPCPVFYVGPCGDDRRDTIDERKAEVIVTLAETYQRAKEAEATAKATKEKARDEIKAHLPDGGKPELPNGWKVSFSKRRKTGTEVVDRFDEERFRADHPDLYEEYTSTEERDTWSSERVVVTPPKDGW